MAETITISRKAPPIKSMDYKFLKKEGIRRIQELAGEIWTDYNEHDPGVTILEILCYAITDLGYRTTFDMKDLLASDPDDENIDPYKFYTAREILLNNPVTLQDYRKLLMDVSVRVDESDPESEIIGIKNAWITISKDAEYHVFVDDERSRLAYEPAKLGSQEPLDLRLLYKTVLEFSDSETFGDLNQDILEDNFEAFHENVSQWLNESGSFTCDETLPDYDKAICENISGMSANERKLAREQAQDLLDLIIKVKVEFPRWDELNIDWNELDQIKASIKKVQLSFINLPDSMGIQYKLDNDNNILLASLKEGLKDRPVPFINDITNRINCLILGKVDSMLTIYQQKVLKILEILKLADARLHAHRNLCEDFYRFEALRVEEILVCADIELEPNANVGETEAEIYFLIDQFLSPTVNFYSLDEILSKDLDSKKYEIENLDQANNRITIGAKLHQELEIGDTVSVSGFGAEVNDYTILSISKNVFNEIYTDIEVVEDLTDVTQVEGSFFFAGDFSEEELRVTEKVFEGPALDNGFIDDEELKIADRREVINASDIINLIMDVEGVVAVKKLEIANSPQDENPLVQERTVKWCLKLAVDKNYVPRLSTSRSRITFYKDELPFTANLLEVESRFQEKKLGQRDQKIANPKLDFEIPKGVYRELKDFTSIQEDFPLTYGVSSEGVPVDYADREEGEQRKLQAKQLKGFLMVFDQLFSNFLAQLNHVKDLFSFNPKLKKELSGGDMLPEEYNFIVNKTYFSQPIVDIAPNARELYLKNKGAGFDEDLHADELQTITEDQATFEKRRNKFLDHLIGRFAESFSNYAMLASRLEGSRSELELIEDKQDFLTRYPDLSGNRGRAFNYKSPYFWHLDNVFGLVKRSSFLAGIDPAEVDQLVFNPAYFTIEDKGDGYHFSIKLSGSEKLTGTLKNEDPDQIKLALERVILCGLYEENYAISCRKVNNQKEYSFMLNCAGMVVAEGSNKYEIEADAKTVIQQYIEDVFKPEFFNNPLSNRSNYSLPFDAYFTSEITNSYISLPNKTYEIRFKLYAQPFQFSPEFELLQGTLKGEVEPKDLNPGTTAEKKNRIKETAKQKVRAVFWDIIFWGREDCQYRSDQPEELSIFDRIGDTIASGNISVINGALADIGTNEEGFKAAVFRMRQFIEENFFRQEGFHLVEHILLRPKINNVWVPLQPEEIQDIPENDSFIPVETAFENLVQVSSTGVIISGNVLDQLRFNLQITISSNLMEETYQVASFRFEDGNTVIKFRQDINPELVASTALEITYTRRVRIIDIEESDLKVTLEEGEDTSNYTEGDEISIVNAKGDETYGVYRILGVTALADSPVLELSELEVQDKLLPIYLPAIDNDIVDEKDCDACKVTNPYSYIVQVAVPAWPGRFDNIDFRKFFEKTIRMEAPAHVFLNICWIGYDQMELFERRVKTWLLENLKDFPIRPYKDVDKEQLRRLAQAQNEVVEILYELRNVYPVKTLHDCDEGESTEGAIILNQTAIGEI